MKVYGYFRSSASYRLRIALNLKGLAPEQAFVHLRRDEQRAPDYLALNPEGLVPALVTDDGQVLTQSLAIIEWLDERFPLPRLLPEDADGRARVRAIALAIACDIHPIDNLRVLAYLRDRLGLDQAARDAWYAHWVAEGLTALEARLARDPATGRFCHGDTPTLADICLVPQLANAARMGCPLDAYPTLIRIADAAGTLPAFADAAPGRQPDAE
ncbi:maleylacetoacetate isomerase [uncultured Tistrella sp.]|uniref:maleylacetoacetate isomerase n=1 Tax=Tistrella mobilis TaxID=171437 RepID=UPI000C0977F7|nr:maleylacetoacetate isomerase [uncultured Tistrella sp.]MAM72862.1 maleylacetoacetate isomerase [Tistrella sp.]